MAEYAIASLYLDIICVLMLGGFILLGRFIHRRNLEEKLFFIMSITVLFITVSDIFVYAFNNSGLSFTRHLVMISKTLELIGVLCIVCEWILFMDYMLHGSVEYLYRTYKKIFMPVLVLAIIIVTNPITKLVFSVGEDMSVVKHMGYHVTELVEIAYFLVPLYIVIVNAKKGEIPVLTHLNAIMLPIVSGELADIFVEVHLTPMEMTISLVFLYCSMIVRWRFEDKKSSFQNKEYLAYLEERMAVGKLDFRSIMLFEDKQNSTALLGILEDEKPESGDMIRLDDSRVLFCTDKIEKSAQKHFVNMITADVEEHNEAHPEAVIELQVELLEREKDEATSNWIRRINEFVDMGSDDAGRANLKRFRKILEKDYKGKLLYQVLNVFIAGFIVTGATSFFALKNIADKNVMRDREELTSYIAEDLKNVFREYDCYEWVIGYWIDHKDELDIEYDKSEETSEKEKIIYGKYPKISFLRLTEEKAESLPPEDQKMVAEILFNRILIRMNAIKKAYQVSYLYAFFVDKDCRLFTVLVSAADEGMTRGTRFGDAYILGTTVENNEVQREAFSKIKFGFDHLVASDGYIDRYSYFMDYGDNIVMVGMTYDYGELQYLVEKDTMLYTTLFLALLILLAGTSLIAIHVLAVRPLVKLKQTVDEYSDTKDGDKVKRMLDPIKTRNEISDLAKGFSNMVSEIQDYISTVRDVTAEKERIGTELNVATQIQADMLPSVFPPFPDVPEIDVYATMDPAKEVGGDFYDFFMVDDDHVALVVADVSGKGVPASLFMAISKSLIKSRTLLGGTPAQILYDVNNQLCEGNEAALFVTVWLVIIDIRTGEGIGANAGHEHPVIRRAGGKYELVVYPHSMAVGVMGDLPFKDHTFQLEPGDRIFCYSDGVPEATNLKDELYGTDRMIAALNKNTKAGLVDTLNNLRNDMDRFVGEAMQFDDITMLMFDFYDRRKS